MKKEDGPAGIGVDETVDVAHSPPPKSPPPKSAAVSAVLAAATPELPLIDPELYEILGVHGRGGLGRILRARDRRTGRIVAIKEILHDNASVIARFQREALVTANLQHPAIVPVYEVGRWPSGKPFYAMKLVVGRTLAEAIDSAGSLTGRLALVPHAAQVASALAYAHDQGWIHRDLKPANVLVGDFGETVVIDWGLARRRAPGPGVVDLDAAPGRMPLTSRPPSLELPPSAGGGDDTQAGTVVGTPVYMAPEQARGEPIDARADVYAIGALLYHVLGGVAPYRECRTADDVIARVAVSPPRPLGELAPELPPDLIAIVERAMARDADLRYPTAGELAIDLGRFQAGVLVEAHRYTLRERLRKFVGRHRGAVAVAVIAIVAVVAISTIAIRNVVVARDTARTERTRAEAARTHAERESGEARRSLAALHRELGRAALADGAPGRALPHLARALRSSDEASADHGVLRVATGLAADPLRGARGLVNAGATVFAIQVEGGWVLPATMAEDQLVWNLGDGAVLRFDGVHGRLSRDGRMIALRSPDFRSVEVRRLDRGGPIAVLGGDGLVHLDGFAGDDRLWIGFDRGTVRRWRITDEATPDGEVHLPGPLHRIHVGTGGRWGIAAGSRGQVWRFDLDRGAVSVLDPGGVGRPEVEAVRVLGDDLLAAFAGDGTLRLWRVDAATPRTITDVHTDGVPAATRDGRYIAVWSASGRVRVVATERATVGPPLADPSPSHTVVAISSDGHLIATGDADGEVAVWSAGDGTRIAAAPGHADAVTAIAFAPDDRTVISAAASGDVRAWRHDDTTRELVIRHDARIWDGAFVTSDRVVTAGADRRGRLTGITGAEIATLAHDAEVTRLDQTAGLIATCAADGVARLWKPDGRPGATLGKPGSACEIAIAPTGARVAVGRDTGVAIYRLDGTFERDIETDGLIEGLAWSRDGARLFAIHPDGTSLWTAGTGKRVAQVESRGALRGIVVSPDRELAALRTDGYEVEVISTRDGASAFVVALDQRIAAITWTDDASLLVATRGGRLDQYDHKGTRQASIRLGGDGPTTIAVRPDGGLLAVGGELGELELWDRAAGKVLARRAVHGEVVAVRWSPDGDRLLIVSNQATATLWDLSVYAGSLDQLDRLIQCRAPFQLAGDRLVAAAPPPDCHPAHFVD